MTEQLVIQDSETTPEIHVPKRECAKSILRLAQAFRHLEKVARAESAYGIAHRAGELHGDFVRVAAILELDAASKMKQITESFREGIRIMTAREFKNGLAAGDKLAVVMLAILEAWSERGNRVAKSALARCSHSKRDAYERDAAHILAALDSAERKANEKALKGFSAEDLKELHASAGVKK